MPPTRKVRVVRADLPEAPEDQTAAPTAPSLSDSALAAPLWPDLMSTIRQGAQRPAFFALYRDDPPTGYLGKIQLDCDEEWLRRKYGGRIFHLEPRTAAGGKMPGLPKKEITIEAPPLDGNDPIVGSKDIAKVGPSTDILQLQQQHFERMLRLQEEQRQNEKELQRREREQKVQDAEASLRLLREEARARQEELETKAKIELQRLEIAHKNERELARLNQQTQQEQYQQFLMAMQQNAQVAAKQQSELFTALLSRPNSGLELVEKLLPALLEGKQEDPGVAITREVAKGIQSMGEAYKLSSVKQIAQSKLAQAIPGLAGPASATDGGRTPPARAAPVDLAAFGEKGGRIQAKMQNLFATLLAKGEDPERILDEALEFYASDSGDEDAEEGDGELSDGQSGKAQAPEPPPKRPRGRPPKQAPSGGVHPRGRPPKRRAEAPMEPSPGRNGNGEPTADSREGSQGNPDEQREA